MVGIDLPSSPQALKLLRSHNNGTSFASRVYYKQGQFFHPKVYLVRQDDYFKVFIGSGNCTQGGMEQNIEFNVCTDDSGICKSTLDWFNALFKNGIEITDTFLNSYTALYRKRMDREKEVRAELQLLLPQQNNSVNLENIDFTNQYFKYKHFAAFKEDKKRDYSKTADDQRKDVRNKLFKLHEKLYPHIRSKNWNIHEHYVYDDTVSSAVHSAYTSTELRGIWLHYGRSKPEIKAFGDKETPLDFMRLQVIIHENNVGIWNRVGKDNGSRIDRDHLRAKLRNDAQFTQFFFEVIDSLPEGYFIRLNNEKKPADNFKDAAELKDFILQDKPNFYFVIGIEFAPDDSNISEDNIVATILDNFERLLPTYEMIKYSLSL